MAKDRALSRSDVSEEENGSRAGRWAAVLGLLAAMGLAAYLMLPRDEYTVTAEFQNAAQLVEGNEVVVGGHPAGSVDKITLGPNGEALVELSVSEPYAPLREGTVATIRSFSLSGIANRQVQLTIPPGARAARRSLTAGLSPSPPRSRR